MNDHLAQSAIARALSHPARLNILSLLAEQPECSGADVFAQIPLAQSTVSEHLRVLRDAGLVHSHSVGTSRVYCVDTAPLTGLSRFLTTLGADAPVCPPIGEDCNE